MSHSDDVGLFNVKFNTVNNRNINESEENDIDLAPKEKHRLHCQIFNLRKSRDNYYKRSEQLKKEVQELRDTLEEEHQKHRQQLKSGHKIDLAKIKLER